jgi:hypothetical protein
MYIGDGSGADGMCANVGNDDLGGRVGENGVTKGFAFCFDEWSNGSTESGIKIFYNAGPDSGGDGHGCPAMFSWHQRHWHCCTHGRLPRVH